MLKKDLFEYAVIRVVPRVEREEFLNVGVILYCRDQRFLKCLFEIDEDRLRAFSNEVEVEILKERLNAFCHVCEGGVQGGPIGALPIASRFRWLTASRSTVVQTSPVHPGLSIDLEETLKRLQSQLVEKPKT